MFPVRQISRCVTNYACQRSLAIQHSRWILCVTRELCPNPDVMRNIYVDGVPPPTKPVTTRVNLFRAVLPGGKTITAEPPDDMPPGSPFGPGMVTLVTYFHGCQWSGTRA
jgi:hypothetical protein